MDPASADKGRDLLKTDKAVKHGSGLKKSSFDQSGKMPVSEAV